MISSIPTVQTAVSLVARCYNSFDEEVPDLQNTDVDNSGCEKAACSDVDPSDDFADHAPVVKPPKRVYCKSEWRQLVLAMPTAEVWNHIKKEMRSEDGLHLIKGRPYSTLAGKVQVMKCTGFRRYKCPYELKVIEDTTNETCSIFGPKCS
jgi:hypothetical protein